MSEPFLAEIRIFGFSFAPKNWASCDGAIIPIQQNAQLFSILGTNFGGNGTTTFQLPQLQSLCAVGIGQGTGLASYNIGDTGGTTTHTLAANEGSVHTHDLMCINPVFGAGTDAVPGPTMAFGRGVEFASGKGPYNTTNAKPVQMAATVIAPNDATGVANPIAHPNVMPFLAVNYCIALQGIFPPRQP